MDFELNRLLDYSEESLIAEIHRVDKIVNKDKLTRPDFNKYSKVSASTLRRRFGSYGNALKAAGLSHKYDGKNHKLSTFTTKQLSNEDVLNELIRISKRLKKDYLTTDDVKDNSELIGLRLIRSRFKTFENALNLAGLQISKLGKKYTDEERFDNLLNVWTHYGRIPTYKEMCKEPSKVGGKAYISRWGSWNKALHAFVEFVNSDKTEIVCHVFETPLQNKKIKVPEEDKREIRVGLRYKVLVRDNFKCVRCGSSPVTDFGCKLVIDHKLPFSLGGKTVLENLETKCEICNLGKSNKFKE